jgi:gas vesicle protein
MEVESLVRENRTLQASLQMVQQTIVDSVNEIQRLNETISNSERTSFNLKNQLDQVQREG